MKKTALVVTMILVIQLFALAMTGSAAANWPTIQNGSRGAEAYAVQKLLCHNGYSVSCDGIIGSGSVNAIKQFQRAKGLVADGIAGTNTLSRLVVTVSNGSRNNAVYALQYLLKNKFGQNISVDGAFGNGTLTSVKAFQSAMGLSTDGIVGQDTWKHLFGVSARTIQSGSSNQSAISAPANSIRTYSLSRNGETYLSKNFKVREFKCNDGSDTILIDTALVNYLQQIRDYFGKPVNITSAYRTVSYNKKIGGASDSYHTKGQAADIYISGVSTQSIYDYAKKIGMKGVIWYPNQGFVHIDTRTSTYHNIDYSR